MKKRISRYTLRKISALAFMPRELEWKAPNEPPMTKEEYVTLMQAKGFTFSPEALNQPLERLEETRSISLYVTLGALIPLAYFAFINGIPSLVLTPIWYVSGLVTFCLLLLVLYYMVIESSLIERAAETIRSG